jgi:perosamine synthetase
MPKLTSAAKKPDEKQEFIPLCIPEIRGNEPLYLNDCLDTVWVSSVGKYVNRFEEELARYVGGSHAIATVNGTAALHVAVMVAGVEPDDEVIVPSLTFIATANAVRYACAWPVFIDVEPDYFQIDVEKLRSFIKNDCVRKNGGTINKHTGRRVKAIIPVHLLGHPVDMDPLIEIAAEYGLAIIEDATESLGARYKGRMTGRLGDIACFSFNGNKIITCGGGGMIVTDNPDWAARARYLTTQARDETQEYVHNSIGYNYRLTNLQAAMGCAQLEQIDDFIAAKRKTAALYAKLLGDQPGIRVMKQAEWAESIFWMYTIHVDREKYRTDARGLRAALREAGIESRTLWQPLHLSPAHKDAFSDSCDTAARLYKDCLSIPCSVGALPEQIERVAERICSLAR